MASLLEGIRVLDFGRVLAGPHAALLLASVGAEVIKIERPAVGDDSRANGYLYPDGTSAYFMQQNWAKMSLALDLKKSGAIEICRELVRLSDVVIENFRPGTMEALGLGWETLSELNTRLIMCAISAYGQTGPHARLPGYGSLAEARAGIPEMTGEPDGPPMPSVVPVADSMAASHAFGAICAALFARERTGRGEYIDIALLDCAFETHDWPVQMYLASNGEIQLTRRGMVDRALVPWGYFKTSNGYVGMLASNDSLWHRLSVLMGQPDLADDDAWESGCLTRQTSLGQRVGHGALLVAYMSAASARLTQRFRAPTVSYGYDRIRFIRPVLFGDTVSVEYKIVAKNADRLRAFAEVRCTNQDGQLVAIGTHIMQFLQASDDAGRS
jgi:crotonobetainyl-CoA:carnitine CoA-transferase CaiB-like acyl-CoA transferase